MEITEELKELLKAHELASVVDFIDEEEEDTYLENTDLDLACIKLISKKYEGYSCGRLEEEVIDKLKGLIEYKNTRLSDTKGIKDDLERFDGGVNLFD